METVIYVNGMMCPHCQARVESVCKAVAGVEDAVVDLKAKTVTVKGGKTGYVDESGVSLVSYAESSDGKAYINVIVGKPKGEGLSESVSTSEVKYIYNNYAK